MPDTRICGCFNDENCFVRNCIMHAITQFGFTSYTYYPSGLLWRVTLNKPCYMPCAASTVRTSQRVSKAAKCRVHQSRLRLSGYKGPLERPALHWCTTLSPEAHRGPPHWNHSSYKTRRSSIWHFPQNIRYPSRVHIGSCSLLPCHWLDPQPLRW